MGSEAAIQGMHNGVLHRIDQEDDNSEMDQHHSENGDSGNVKAAHNFGSIEQMDTAGTPPDKVDSTSPTKRTWRQVWRDYPKSTFCIFGNGLCERFAFYGMRAVLTLYLVNMLGYHDSDAMALYSGFMMVCYFCPIFGCIIADGYIGKFHTILWVSVFYSLGFDVLMVASFFSKESIVHPWLDFIGLALLAVGNGGVRPCLQSFGGDQYRKGQEKELSQFFFIFYFCINVGSTISMAITPILRTQPCQGQLTCYPLAFGIPAALMAVAVVSFAAGSWWYNKVPPQGNVFSKVAKIAHTGLRNKHTFELKRDHWLDHYLDNHSCKLDNDCHDKTACAKEQLIRDIKALFRVLVVFIPLPIFWALYQQQASGWVLQGTEMNSVLADGVFLLPDQLGVVNTILIMILIPFFQIVLYPVLGKLFKLTPLRKMITGGFMAGLAYIICMIVQFKIQSSLPMWPGHGETLVTVANYVQDCPDINFVAKYGNSTVINGTIARNENHMFPLRYPNEMIHFDVDYGSSPCPWVDTNRHKLQNGNVRLIPDMAGYVIFTSDNTDLELHAARTEKSKSGEIVFSLNVNYYINDITDNTTVILSKGSQRKEFSIQNRTSKYNQEMTLGTWEIFIKNTLNNADEIKISSVVQVENQGGIFTLTIFNGSDGNITSVLMRQANDNNVSILWQLPQYFLMTIAELLFSITGNEFAYSQAPLNMKAMVMALWMMTNGMGNLIILIVSLCIPAAGFNMAWLYLFYGALMLVFTVIFIFIAINYKYSLYVRDGKEKK